MLWLRDRRAPSVSRLAALLVACCAAAAPVGYNRNNDEEGTEGETSDPAPETDWFSAAGHGIFTHYLDGLQNSAGSPNSNGRQTSWSDCVDEFDVEAYADSAAAAHAKFAFVTMMQGSRFLAAPNAVYDGYTGYAPGNATARRDLPAELSAALAARGIRLMLYFTGDGPWEDAQAAAGLGWPDAPASRSNVPQLFAERWADVLREYAVRYGAAVGGWWLDGCYPTAFNYTPAKLRPYFDAVRAGNAGGLLAQNVGVRHPISRYSPWEDFTCGESNDLVEVPAARFVNGSQWHTLSFLGEAWAAGGVRYNATYLADYVRAVNAVGGVVTVDAQLFRNGSINAAQVAVIGAAFAAAEARAAAANTQA